MNDQHIPTPRTKHWIEDSGHENGNYQCNCIDCGEIFRGHKRRVVCKLCSELAALTKERDEAINEVVALRILRDQRLTAAQAACAEKDEALKEDALLCFDMKNPPLSLTAEWNDGTGKLTSGPNNCQQFKEKRQRALSNIAGQPILDRLTKAERDRADFDFDRKAMRAERDEAKTVLASRDAEIADLKARLAAAR